MKKLLVSIFAMLVAAPSFAQFSSGGFELDKNNMYYGIRLGITSASISGESATVNGVTLSNDLGAKVGMTLAGVVGLRVSDTTPVFLESGLYYTERGGKEGNVTVGYNNLEIPILIKYGIKATDDIAILPFIGPYFSYAFSGKTKYEDGALTAKVGTFDEKKAPTGGLKRANMGFKIGCGAEYNKLYLEIGYQLGVTNICKNDNLSAHSNALFANFGINF